MVINEPEWVRRSLKIDRELAGIDRTSLGTKAAFAPTL
jgi:hypothetical protein